MLNSEEEQLYVTLYYALANWLVMTTNQGEQHQKVHRGGGEQSEAPLNCLFGLLMSWLNNGLRVTNGPICCKTLCRPRTSHKFRNASYRVQNYIFCLHCYVHLSDSMIASSRLQVSLGPSFNTPTHDFKAKFHFQNTNPHFYMK